MPSACFETEGSSSGRRLCIQAWHGIVCFTCNTSSYRWHVDYIIFFMFAPCINSIKTLLIIPTDAHCYKITGMLEQLKFRQLLRRVSVHAGTIIRELFSA